MKDRLLKQIFRAFEMMNRCWDGEEGAASGSDGGEGGSEGGNDVIGATIAKPYLGSKELNPEQRPLRMNVDGYDNQAIDDLIDVSDDPFLTDEEIVAMEKAAEKEGDKGKSDDKDKGDDKGGKPDDKTDDDKGKSDDKGEGDEEDPDVKHFYETTGLTQEEFKGLSETARKNLHDKVFVDPATSEADTEKISKLEADNKKLSDSLNALNEDPIISLRLDEHATGKSYVAKSIPGVTPEQANAIYEADSIEEATRLVNKFFTDNVTEAVKIERGHTDAKEAQEKITSEANDIVNSLGEMDKRLKFKNGEEAMQWFVDDFNIYNKNPQFEEMVKMTKILRDRGITTGAQITALGKDHIYAIIQRENGWDKDRDDKIVKDAKKNIMEKLLNPRIAKGGKKAATSLMQGGRDVNIKEGVNRKALIEELKNGNPATFNKLAERFEGDLEMTEELGRIQREGAKARREFLDDKT